MIECHGDPRDIGFDQGSAVGSELQARFARSRGRLGMRLGRRDAHSAVVMRDVARHFPHQAEAIEGLARGARVPKAWVDREIVRALATAPTPSAAATAMAACDSLCGAPALVVCTAPRDAVYRRVCAESGFRSLEVTLPWFPGALVGVNEKGLAVACAPGPFTGGGCWAPAAFLVRDCLRQFESLEPAIEWCATRPAAARAALLVADARGEVACVDVTGGERRVRRPIDGLLWSAVPHGDDSAKLLREKAPVDPARLARVFLDTERRVRTPDVIVLDPADLRLGLFAGDAAPDVRWASV